MHYTSKEVYEYISKQMNDPIVEWKTCEVSRTQFPIYQSDLDFYDKISPVINWVKYQIPTPKLCPEERERQRLMFRNERHLYKNTCKATGKAIISHHDSDAPFPVYEQSYWWSDARDAQNYALSFEGGKSIMQHLKELSDQVPRFNLYSLNVENCSYSNYIGNSKSCYLTYASTNCEHLIYSRAGAKSSSCCDVFFAEDCHECYEIIKCQNCSKVKHAILCENCYDCEYVVGCNGCSFCYHCSDLTNQSYCIDNKPYSPEEWKIEVEKRRKLNQTSYPHSEKLQQSDNLSIENSYGSFLTECRNVAFCHGMSRAENCKYMRDEIDTQDNQDVYGAMLSSQCYQSISTVQSSHVLFSSYIGRSKDLIYCSYCYDCENCFGCIGLKNKQYCIFNKQYSPEEYWITLAQLLSQAQKEGIRWAFFPLTLSPFCYNESIAYDEYPLTKEEALARKYARKEENQTSYVGQDTIHASELPKSINEVDDGILQKIILCEESHRPYRIIKQELEFYRKHSIPLPKKHPDIRHQHRHGRKPKYRMQKEA